MGRTDNQPELRWHLRQQADFDASADFVFCAEEAFGWHRSVVGKDRSNPMDESAPIWRQVSRQSVLSEPLCTGLAHRTSDRKFTSRLSPGRVSLALHRA